MNTIHFGLYDVCVHLSLSLALNITPVSLSQRVDHLLLTGGSVDITLSFQVRATPVTVEPVAGTSVMRCVSSIQPASHCSDRFPVLNHTVSVEGLEGGVVPDSTTDSLISVTLTPTTIPSLTVDSIYTITITACTELTCRSPPQPLVASENHCMRTLYHHQTCVFVTAEYIHS